MPPLNSVSKTCLALAISHCVALPTLGQAATITVTSNRDDGTGCTLREAIVSTNTSTNQNNGCAVGSDSGTDTITFSSNAFLLAPTTVLTNGELRIGEGKDIVIDANNIPGGITIDANFQSRLLNIDNASVSMNSITLTRGGFEADETSRFNAIDVNNATLTLSNSRLSNNLAVSYNAIFRARRSEVTITNSTISNNSYSQNNPNLTPSKILDFDDCVSVTLNEVIISGNQNDSSIVSITDTDSASINASTISANTTSAGSILNIRRNDSVSITNSTISDNTSSTEVLRLNDNPVLISNSTISNNSPTGSYSPRLMSLNNTDLNLVNSTINNTAFRANFQLSNISVYSGSTRISVINSIITDSPNGPDCTILRNSVSLNAVSSDSNSIMQGAGCETQARSVDPLLGPLADHGGPTLTHSLLPDSPAINTGNDTNCLNTDQRGETRDGICDVGAFEFIEGQDEPDDSNFFVVPLRNGKAVIFEL